MRWRRGRRARATRQLIQLVLALALVAGVFFAERLFELRQAPGPAREVPPDAVGPCRARHVVDGDTVRLHCGGEDLHVRMLRIDTPEREEPGYVEATRALRELLGGRDVYVVYEEPGLPARGNYGRVLAYLFAGGRNANVEMVRAGWSHFDTRWGEGRFASDFRAAEREARRAGRL